MIRMNLQLFAKTKAQQQAYRKTLAIRKQNQPGSKNLEDVMNKEKEEEKQRSSSVLSSQENIKNSEKVSKNESYVLLRIDANGNANGRGVRAGTDLKEDIAYERLILIDKKRGIWESKKSGTRFVIRRKR